MEEAKWYVVHTFSGYENKVKVDIEKTVENRNLQDQILEVAIPLQEVMENKDGQKKSSMRKIFPAYVLVHMIMNDDTWYVIRNTRGVTGFVGPGSKPVPLTEDLYGYSAGKGELRRRRPYQCYYWCMAGYRGCDSFCRC